jgi:flagellar biosynthesis protein FliR
MTLAEPELGAFIAVFVRTSALVATAPVIGDAGVSVRAKLVLVVAVSIAIAANREPIAFAELPATAVLELAVGLVTGLAARFIVARVAIAGQLMGLSLGLGFASEYDVHAGESAGVIRTLASTLTAIAFVSVGGFEAIVRSVASGPAHVTHLVALGPLLLDHAASAFGHGLMLAAPIVLASLVGNLGLAVINRAAPAVNVFSISLAAVLILGGLVLLATAASFAAGASDSARDAIAQLLG